MESSLRHNCFCLWNCPALKDLFSENTLLLVYLCRYWYEVSIQELDNLFGVSANIRHNSQELTILWCDVVSVFLSLSLTSLCHRRKYQLICLRLAWREHEKRSRKASVAVFVVKNRVTLLSLMTVFRRYRLANLVISCMPALVEPGKSPVNLVDFTAVASMTYTNNAVNP